jgi:hypothetical protein
MRLRTLFAGVALLALAACARPQPLTDAQKTALADSVDQVATQMMTAMAAHPTVETYLSHFVHGNDWVHAEYGKVYPTYDAYVAVTRAAFHGVTAFHLSLSDKRFTVLGRDAVVMTATIGGTMRDSAEAETPFHEAWSAVYIRTADGWKITADHESTAPPAPPPQAAAPARKKR